VIEIALDHLAHHGDAEEIRRQHPHLSLARIQGALTYFFDHEAELDEDIEQQLDRVAEIQSGRMNPAFQARLRAACQ
jgi:hypothetical protein